MGRVEPNNPTEATRKLIAETAAEARRPYALAIKANLAKLEQLNQDATKKIAEADADSNSFIYWSGWQDGITRAIKVLEGRG